MHGLGARAPGGVEDPLLVQVALGRRPAADQIGLVRVRDVAEPRSASE